MKKHIITILAIFVILIGVIALYGQNIKSELPTPTNSPSPSALIDELSEWENAKNEKQNLIRIVEPQALQEIISPIRVKGEARGNWYFEASFPVYIVDADGKEITVAPVQAIGEWMTTNFVPFETIISFNKPQTKKGFIIFKKDNPSGLPEHDDELRMPIIFK